MSERTITIRNWFPHRFVLDPEAEDGAETPILPLRIRRFTVEQGKAFNQRWDRLMDPPSARAIFRKSDGDEQAMTTRGKREVYVVDDDEVRRRRIQEMAEDERVAFQAQAEIDAADEYAFIVEVVSEHLRVAPGTRVVLEADDDSATLLEVRAGGDLVKAFGGNRTQMRRLAMAIWAENNLGSHEKKAWRSLSDSKPSSNAPATAAVGQTPAATAAPVGPEDSAATAAATESREPILSGSTQT